MEQIVSLTGLSVEQAKFFLDSCGGDTEAALNTYLETQPESPLSNLEQPDQVTEEPLPLPTRETVYQVCHVLSLSKHVHALNVCLGETRHDRQTKQLLETIQERWSSNFT